MSQNHLLIGLGGTGGKVLKCFRHAVVETFRSKEPLALPGEAQPPRVRYLYVDSSSRDLEASAMWKTQGELGSDISLDENSRFSITENNLKERLNDPQNYPITHRYIGEPNLWSDILSSMKVSETAAGMIRRLGNSLLEPRCKAFVGQVQSLVNQLKEESNAAEAGFHVVAGLAGGTGSGSFLQVIAQLRSLYPNAKHYPIYLYLLLPEPNSPWAKNEDTNYYANGFAALQELNAYLVSDPTPGPAMGGPLFVPVDLTGETRRFENVAKSGASRLSDRLQACFLASSVNEENHAISVDTEIPDLFAQLLFQRIFLLDRPNQPNQQDLRILHEAISLENLKFRAEGKRTNAQIEQRSRLFQAFGVKRLIIPEEEIRSHFTANLALQATLQMRYNNWVDGFRANGVPVSFKEFVQQDENRNQWKLTNEHIMLSRPILEIEQAMKGWVSIRDEWDRLAPIFKAQATDLQPAVRNNRDVRLDYLSSLFQERYMVKYRNLGVPLFYETKRADLKQPDRHVAAISNEVEQWMMTEWSEGNRSAYDLECFLNDLIEDLGKRVAKIPERLEKLKTDESALHQKIEQNRKTWPNIGTLAAHIPIVRDYAITREKVIQYQTEHLRQYYMTKNLQEAWRFAQSLLSALISELRDRVMKELVGFRSGLDKLEIFFKTRLAETCANPGVAGVQENTVQFYEVDKVRGLAAKMIDDEQKQRSWSGAIRRAMLVAAGQKRQENKGKDRYFGELVTHLMISGAALTLIERISAQNAEEEHDNLTGTQGRQIGANLVAKLSERYPNPLDLRGFVKSLVKSAQTFVEFDQGQFDGGAGPQSVMAIILPEAGEHSAFRQQLASTFIAAQKPGVQVKIVDSRRKPNEITIISFKYAFPLRQLLAVRWLNEQYDLRLLKGTGAIDRRRAELEIHTEDCSADRRPSLFRPVSGESAQAIMPLLQIGQALGLFKRQVDPVSRKAERVLEVLNVNQVAQPEYYPDEIVSLLEPAEGEIPPPQDDGYLSAILLRTTEEQVEHLEDAVSAAHRKYPAVRRRELGDAIRLQLEQVKSHRGGNTRDPITELFRSSTNKALEKLKTL